MTNLTLYLPDYFTLGINLKVMTVKPVLTVISFELSLACNGHFQTLSNVCLHLFKSFQRSPF